MKIPLPVRRPALMAVALLSAAGPRLLEAQQVLPDSAIRRILEARVDSGRAVGLVVGIVENGERRFIAHGSAGPARPRLDEHTIFEIGSITKTFNALLLADAVTRGELRLDQPVAELLPAGTVVPSRDGRVITLEHLATHRSGLPRLPANIFPGNLLDPYAHYDSTRLHAFLRDHELRRAPGDTAEYSNVGAGLLGYALTMHAGAPSWASLARQRITNPLGMNDTWVDVPESSAARVAAGHSARLDTVPPWRFDALAGAGALRSSTSDLLTYLEAMIDTTRGPLARAAALAITPRADFQGQARIALGWVVHQTQAGPIWLHDGGTGGHRAIAAFSPSRMLGVVVLSNSTIPATDIALHLMDPSRPLRP